MRSKSIILTGLIFWGTICNGQIATADSLKQLLETAKEDTSRINILNALSADYTRTYDYKNAMEYAGQALSISQKKSFKKGSSVAYRNMGIILGNQGNYSDALSKLNAALKIAEDTGDQQGIAESCNLIGIVYRKQSNYPEALNLSLKALKLNVKLDNKIGMAQSYNNIGNVYIRQENYTEALKHHFAALKINESVGNKAGLHHSYNNIGNIYSELGNNDESLKYLFASLKIREELGNSYEIAGSLSNIGTVYHDMGNYYDALRNYFASLKISEKIGHKEALASTNNNIGKTKISLKEYTEAKKFFEKALNVAKEIGYHVYIKEAYEGLAILDSITNNYEGAFSNYKMFITYRDSLINDENSKKIVQTQLQYEFDKKEDSLKQQHVITQTKLDSQKKQKNFYLAGAGMLALLSLFVFLNFRNQKKINQLMDDAHAKEKAELELQSLRAQLNPHFMFNSLNAIQELILMEENEKSQSYLARFAKLLRLLLENADKPFVPLRAEIDFLQLYLSLEKLRIPDLEFSINVDPGVYAEKTQIPNMILQPYIENAIWHGLSHKENDKRLQIRIANENGFTKYEIEDNGVGRKRSAELKSLYRKEHKSKGMELLSKRFKLLAKEYGSEVETTVTDIVDGKENGTIVTIRVPHNFKTS